MDPNRMVEEDEYAKELGNLILTVASMELFTVHLVWATIHADDQTVGKAVTKTMSVADMAQLIKRRAATFSGDTRDLLENVVKKILDINKRRNALIHSSWTWAELDEEGKPLRGRLSFRDLSNPEKTTVEPTAVPLEEIQAVTEDTKALLWDLTSAIVSVHPGWMFDRNSPSG